MADIRISQEVVETVAQPTPDVAISQVVIETITTAAPAAGIVCSQLVVETIALGSGSPLALFIQHYKQQGIM